MTLVSKSIPNLINGVSQQPPSLRLGSQGEAQENGLSDVVDGLKKRPPTKFLKKLVKCNTNWVVSTTASPLQGHLTTGNVETLTPSELDAAFIHTYKRSNDEQYTVVILPDATTPIVLAYDIVGNLRYQSDKSSWLADGTTIAYTIFNEVTEVDDTYYGNDDDTSYLIGLNATAFSKKNITATSVTDATFIVNRKKVVEKSSIILPEDTHNEALVYLKSVNYGRNYNIKMTSKSKGTVIESTDSSNNDVGTPNNSSNNDKDFELKVSTLVGALRDNLKSKMNVQSSVVASRRTPARQYLSPSTKYDKLWNRGSLSIPFGADNTDTQRMLDGDLNATLNKNQLHITAGGTTVPATGFNLTANGVSIAHQYAWSNTGEPTGSANRGFVFYRRYANREIVVTLLDADQTNNDVQFYPASYNSEPYFICSTEKSTDALAASFGDFDILATDDDGGANLSVFKDTAKTFTSLPAQCVSGFRIAVVGDNQKKEDNFHVQFTGEGGSGYWKETMKAGLVHDFDMSTMPHTLRQGSDLQFSFGIGDWNSRVAGDDDTNGFPSFVGQTINDIFFHRNRLGIIAGENVIFSEASSYFNFFRTTVRTLLDSAPIDVAVSQNEVSDLKAAIPIQDNLLLFSELNQFTLSAAQLLTPTEVSINQSTKFECDLEASPVGAGTSVFFATKAGGFAGVREYYTNNETEIKDAALITSHVPQYLAGNIREMATSSNENMLLCLTSSDKKECYVFKWYDQSNERLQSSWSKWKFAKDIASTSFNNSKIYFVFTDGSFEYVDLAPASVEPITTFGGAGGGTIIPFNNIYWSNANSSDSLSVLSLPTAYAALWTPTYALGLVHRQSNGSVVMFQFANTFNHADITSISIGSSVFNMADAGVTQGNGSGGGVTYTLYYFDTGSSSNPNSVHSIMDAEAANVNIGGGVGYLPISYQVGGSAQSSITFKKAGLEALLDHQVRLEAPTVGGEVTTLTGLYTPTPLTKFVDYKGTIIGTGNSDATQAKVVAAINQKTHLESGETVNDYVYAGEPYQFKYKLSEQVYKPVDGDYTDLSRLQLRSISFNYNDTGTFDVDVKSRGRDTKTTAFTGRILGQKDNILDYSPVVERGSIKVGVQSQAKETDITITNDSHLPCVFQSAEWEGFITLRNKRL